MNEKTRQWTTVGTATKRPDAHDKIAGYTRYVGDIPLCGLLYARLVLSPYAHARILSIDTSVALSLPGVVAVFTGKTLPMKSLDNASRSHNPLAKDEVLWCGHPVALVIGENEMAAEDGANALVIDYEPLAVVLDPFDALLAETSREKANLGIASEKKHFLVGSIEAGFDESDVVIEHTYKTSVVHQSYMEPQSVMVMPDPSGRRLTIWSSTQDMFGVRSEVAEALAIPEQAIRVEPVPIGGSFGGKYGLLEPLVAAAAYTLRKPVRLVCTRQEDLLAANPAPQTVIVLKIGAKRDGTLMALQGHIIFDAGAFPDQDASMVRAGTILAGTYRCPNLDIHCYEVLTNKVSTGAYRAVSAPQTTFALESMIDELSRRLGIDPVEIRQRNILQEGDLTISPRLSQWPRTGLAECLTKLEECYRCNNSYSHSKAMGEVEGWKIGCGIAVGGLVGSTAPASAACRLERDGSCSIIVGGVDLTGSDLSLALIAAEELHVPVSSINVIHNNTDALPYIAGTGGSKGIYSIGPAVIEAACDAYRQMLAIAGVMLEAAVEDLEISNGKVVVRGADKSLPLTEIAEASIYQVRQFEPVYGQGRAANKDVAPIFAAHMARVAVHPETGEVRVLDYIVAQDVGCAINPAEIEGQIHGSVAQGIGWALLEGFCYDEQGQLLTSTLMDYALPRCEDVPTITTVLVEVPSTSGPFGAKGVAEPSVVPVGAAIANAIYDAVGVRIRQLPITAEHLFMAMHDLNERSFS